MPNIFIQNIKISFYFKRQDFRIIYNSFLNKLYDSIIFLTDLLN